MLQLVRCSSDRSGDCGRCRPAPVVRRARAAWRSSARANVSAAATRSIWCRRPSIQPDSQSRMARVRWWETVRRDATCMPVCAPVDAHTSSSSKKCEMSPEAGVHRTRAADLPLLCSSRCLSRRRSSELLGPAHPNVQYTDTAWTVSGERELVQGLLGQPLSHHARINCRSALRNFQRQQ